MNIFDYAMRMEKDGEDYYHEMARQTDNKGLKTILTMLADEEANHYRILQRMKTEKPDMTDTPILSDAKNIFMQLKESNEKIDVNIEQTELYKKAQAIEQNSIDFYLEKADEVHQEYQKQILLNLAAQEKRHFFMLENIIEFVSRPQTWLEDAEFNHLDEY